MAEEAKLEKAHCLGHVTGCDSREYLCLCGEMCCAIHGHTEEGFELPEGWNCTNLVDEDQSAEDKAHWMEQHGCEPNDNLREYWKRVAIPYSRSGGAK
jgi:hypothetical protein